MLGDKAIMSVLVGRSIEEVVVEVRVPGGTVHLDTIASGVVSAFVLDRKGRERDRAVVSVHALVSARLVLR